MAAVVRLAQKDEERQLVEHQATNLKRFGQVEWTIEDFDHTACCKQIEVHDLAEDPSTQEPLQGEMLSLILKVITYKPVADFLSFSPVFFDVFDGRFLSHYFIIN